MSVENLLQVMQAQTLLLRELAGLEQKMLRSLLDRNSAVVQECNERYQGLSTHLDQAEKVRIELIRRLAHAMGIVSHPGTQTSPSELMARITDRLDPQERNAFTMASRRFSVAVQELVAMNQALHTYTQAQLVTLDGFLTELFPSRDQGTYGADGRHQSNGRPMLLNRHI